MADREQFIIEKIGGLFCVTHRIFDHYASDEYTDCSVGDYVTAEQVAYEVRSFYE